MDLPSSTCVLSLFLPRKGIIWCGVRAINLDKFTQSKLWLRITNYNLKLEKVHIIIHYLYNSIQKSWILKIACILNLRKGNNWKTDGNDSNNCRQQFLKDKLETRQRSSTSKPRIAIGKWTVYNLHRADLTEDILKEEKKVIPILWEISTSRI